MTGAVTATLQDVADQPAGTAHETFHFVRNDTILSDDRIPAMASLTHALPEPDAAAALASGLGLLARRRGRR